MELLRDPKFDFLGKKFWFLGLSAIFVVAAIVSISTTGFQWGIDFRGGADVQLKFREAPSVDELRASLRDAGFGGVVIQRFGDPSDNEVLIRFDPGDVAEADAELREESDLASDILAALRTPEEREATAGKVDLNVAGEAELRAALVRALGPGQEEAASRAAAAITRLRNEREGILQAVADVRGLPEIGPEVSSWLDSSVVAGRFAIRSIDYVGPAVGADLRTKARWAVLLSLIAMLVYIAFRFHATSFGMSAIVTLAHDVAITLGFLSFFRKEFDLTVLAAVLTIVGYSINDTIVIFDRVRDNLRLRRQEDIEKIFNDSINQTLSRTLLTNLLVFMVLLSIWFFGGSRLEPFAFALIVGAISGTYSTIYVAAPVVIWLTRRAQRRAARA